MSSAAILSALCELEVTSTAYLSRIKPFHAARAAIIDRGIWPQVIADGIERLILDPEVGQDDRVAGKRVLHGIARCVQHFLRAVVAATHPDCTDDGQRRDGRRVRRTGQR